MVRTNRMVLHSCSCIRFLVTGLAVAFMEPMVLAAYRNAHPVKDELYEIFVFTSCIAFSWKWVTEKRAQDKRHDETDQIIPVCCQRTVFLF